MKTILCMFTILAAAFPLMAAEVSSERGKELFGSPELGTNGRSCATCHPGGKGLEEAGEFTDAELTEMVNKCIGNPLQGKELAPESAEMKSLLAYIKSVSEGKQP